MSAHKSQQIAALASLSSPPFDAKAIYGSGDNVRNKQGLTRRIIVWSRWHRSRLYGNLETFESS
jgi:hypothetical protein